MKPPSFQAAHMHARLCTLLIFSLVVQICGDDVFNRMQYRYLRLFSECAFLLSWLNFEPTVTASVTTHKSVSRYTLECGDLFCVLYFVLFLRFQPFWFCFMSDLFSRLERLRGSEKTVGEVGPTLMNWVSVTWKETNNPPYPPPQMLPLLPSSLIQLYQSVCVSVSVCLWLQFPCLEAYVTYCCNQVGAKALLDQKKNEKRVEHFLRLCQESSFSRKLDLWNFLDLPRSRLVKYPLLLKEIQKCTPPDHPDEDTLPKAVSIFF